MPKIEGNVLRDRGQDEYLHLKGWKVLRIWEHEIKDNLDATLEKAISFLETS
ncbi:MAG: DUF559 domain-containing protein [Nanoarchaeota archaeon]|nr:DUF559 domain-containing protein [Nanoarchaeota archaeon]